jgi:phage/plasmid-associated DNA primase
MMMNELDLNDLKRFNKASRKNIILRRNSFESTGGQTAILKQIINRIEDSSDFIDTTFDRTPYLLPIKDNKIVDMRNDVIRERTKNDYFTKYCNIDYDPEVDVEEVKTFLRQYLIRRDKTELDEDDNVHIDMVLGILGYSITGYNNLKKIFVALGPKDTGKSSLFNKKIFEAFKAFYCNADKKVICETKNKAVHTQELFPLVGTRFFSTAELDENEKLNNGFLKSISGDDKLQSLRRCGGDKQFDGIIDCKLILPLNTMSKSADSALLKRLIVIEFPNVFKEKDFFQLPKERRDYIQEGINSKLYSAIIKYAHYFIKNNLTIRWSEQSMMFTNDVVSKCEDVSEFINDNYVFTNDVNDRVSKSDLYNHFCRDYKKSDLCGHKNKFYNRVKQLYGSERNIKLCVGRDAFRFLKIQDKDEDEEIF